MRLQDYDTTNQFTATVIQTDRITPDSSPDEVREIVLDVSGSDFEVKIGQNIGVLAPRKNGFGKGHHFRLYSIAGLPERQSNGHVRLPICVRRCDFIDEYNGRGIRGLHRTTYAISNLATPLLSPVPTVSLSKCPKIQTPH